VSLRGSSRAFEHCHVQRAAVAHQCKVATSVKQEEAASGSLRGRLNKIKSPGRGVGGDGGGRGQILRCFREVASGTSRTKEIDYSRPPCVTVHHVNVRATQYIERRSPEFR
jgi:hypothetical protein